MIGFAVNHDVHDVMNGSSWTLARRRMKNWRTKAENGIDCCSRNMYLLWMQQVGVRCSQELTARLFHHYLWQPRSLAAALLLQYRLNTHLIQPDRYVNGLAWLLRYSAHHCPTAWFDNSVVLSGNLQVPH